MSRSEVPLTLIELVFRGENPFEHDPDPPNWLSPIVATIAMILTYVCIANSDLMAISHTKISMRTLNRKALKKTIKYALIYVYHSG